MAPLALPLPHPRHIDAPEWLREIADQLERNPRTDRATVEVAHEIALKISVRLRKIARELEGTPPANPNQRVRAYTLGNPNGYEKALDEGPIDKAPGGVVFTTRAAAQRVLDAFDGHLPPQWFGGRKIPGRVYALDLPGPICEVTVRRDYGLALRCAAPISRVA